MLFTCPHCGIHIEVLNKQLNCKIFRCGVYKSNFKCVDPHMKKENLEKIKNEIYGCGKPFRLNDKLEPIVCGYI